MKEQKKSSWGAVLVSFLKEFLLNSFEAPGHLYYDENLTNEGKRKKNYIWRVLLLVTAVGVALLPFIAWNMFVPDVLWAKIVTVVVCEGYVVFIVRIVDFGDTLVEIFRNARKEQLKNRMQYGELYHTNYYKEVKEKNRVYYEYYCLDRTEEVPADYKEISFVCLRPDGCLELPTTLGTVCRKVAKTLEGFEGFHFHQLRHTYTSNLLANGAAPKDVQELLGHSDVSTTMNVYAHSTRDAKRKSVRLLDKVVGND